MPSRTAPPTGPVREGANSGLPSQVAWIRVSLADHGLTTRLTVLGGTLVLDIGQTATDPDPATVAIDPDLSSGPGLRLECTCTWTPASGAAPEATAETILAVLDAIGRLANHLEQLSAR